MNIIPSIIAPLPNTTLPKNFIGSAKICIFGDCDNGIIEKSSNLYFDIPLDIGRIDFDTDKECIFFLMDIKEKIKELYSMIYKISPSSIGVLYDYEISESLDELANIVYPLD